MSPTPDVSAVIPTFNRPDLVTRAVRSALAQTHENLEVIVVIDGPDPATEAALASIDDARLRVIPLAEQGGAQNARNTGIQAARGEWTALLDDDDEWLPEKIAVQLGLARAAHVSSPIVASRLINRTPRAELVMPRRLPADGEPRSEYLTVRRGLFHGEGFVQTSTIFAPTELWRRVPFQVGLRRLHELDWTLRALHHDDVDLIVAEQPLVLWYTDEDRPRVSFQAPWQNQLDWLRRSRPYLTKRAYAALAMSVVSSMAATTHSPKVFFTVLGEARRHGRPSLIDYVTYLQIWLIPPQLRAILRDRLLGRDRAARTAAAAPVPAGAAAVAHVPAPRTAAEPERVGEHRP